MVGEAIVHEVDVDVNLSNCKHTWIDYGTMKTRNTIATLDPGLVDVLKCNSKPVLLLLRSKVCMLHE